MTETNSLPDLLSPPKAASVLQKANDKAPLGLLFDETGRSLGGAHRVLGPQSSWSRSSSVTVQHALLEFRTSASKTASSCGDDAPQTGLGK